MFRMNDNLGMLMMPCGAKQLSLNFDMLNLYSHIRKGSIIYYTSKLCSIFFVSQPWWATFITHLSIFICTVHEKILDPPLGTPLLLSKT